MFVDHLYSRMMEECCVRVCCITGLLSYRCAIPGYDNDTFNVQSESHARLINATIPYVTRDGKIQLDRCHIYHDVANGTSEGANHTVVGCQKWVYDKSVFESTVSTEVTNNFRGTRLCIVC